MLVLDDRKLLPPGVHDASLKEVEELFGRFQRSDRRPGLFAVQSGSIAEQDWTTFFSRVNVKWCLQFGWPERLTKGIIRVAI